jgi:hypothetical protein
VSSTSGLAKRRAWASSVSCSLSIDDAVDRLSLVLEWRRGGGGGGMDFGVSHDDS